MGELVLDENVTYLGSFVSSMCLQELVIDSCDIWLLAVVDTRNSYV